MIGLSIGAFRSSRKHAEARSQFVKEEAPKPKLTEEHVRAIRRRVRRISIVFSFASDAQVVRAVICSGCRPGRVSKARPHRP